MRQIEDKKQKEKKKNRNYIIMGSILIVLLVFSSVGYAFLSGSGESDNSLVSEYEGIRFERYGSYWKTQIQGGEFYFKYLPSEVENISIQGAYSLSDYSNKPVYFVNPNNAVGEIIQNINNYILRYQEACVQLDYSDLNEISQEDCEGLPLKNCEEDLIIIFEENETNSVRKQGNCVYLSGDPYLSGDAFLYSILKVF